MLVTSTTVGFTYVDDPASLQFTVVPDSIALGDLAGVTVDATPTDGQVLVFDSAAGQWRNLNAVALSFVILTGTQALRIFRSSAANEPRLDLSLSALSAGVVRTQRFPDADGTFVLDSNAQTLNNKTFVDQTFTIQDDGDATKQMRFGLSTVGTGTTRVINVPNANGVMTLADNTQTLSNKTLNNTNAITVRDANLIIQDESDATKQAKFEAGSIASGQTRTITLPDTDGTMAFLAASQVFSNKVLDSSNSITVMDSDFTLQDNNDATKRALFDVANITSGATRTFSFPDVSGTFVLLTNTQTLQNKTLNNTNAITVRDTSFTIQDDGDATKQARFQAAGIPAGSILTYSLPATSGTLALQGEVTGPTGPTGATGPTGPTGLTGPTGPSSFTVTEVIGSSVPVAAGSLGTAVASCGAATAIGIGINADEAVDVKVMSRSANAVSVEVRGVTGTTNVSAIAICMTMP